MKKQPEGCGFVANFGENLPVELRYKIDGIRNFRIKKGNGTMALNCDMNIQFWVTDPQKGPKMALELSQANVIFYFTADVDSSGHIHLTITGKTVGRLQVLNSNLGQPPPPEPGNATNSNSNSSDPEDNEPRKNFGLNMHKIHAFLTKFKPTLIHNFNELLQSGGGETSFTMPTRIFAGLFDLNLGDSRFKFHENYLEMEMNPTYSKP